MQGEKFDSRVPAEPARAGVTRALGFLSSMFSRAAQPPRPARPKRRKPACCLLPEHEYALREKLPAEAWRAAQFALLTGLRWSEQVNLTWGDVQGNELYLPRSRYGPSRRVPLSSLALRILTQIRHSNNGSRYVFGGVDCCKSLRCHFRATVESLDLPTLHWRDLRYTYCVRLAQAGLSAEQIQSQSGLRSMRWAERYLAKRASRAANLRNRKGRTNQR